MRKAIVQFLKGFLHGFIFGTWPSKEQKNIVVSEKEIEEEPAKEIQQIEVVENTIPISEKEIEVEPAKEIQQVESMENKIQEVTPVISKPLKPKQKIKQLKSKS